MRKILPGFVVLVVLAGTVYGLRCQGRLWMCSCDYLLVWSGDAWSSDNSQHLLDPYSFTHVSHGFVFCGLLALVAPGLRVVWRLTLTATIEAMWEVVENSAYVIGRYREGIAALGYAGDTVVNSLSDIVLCGLGFALARRLGFRLTLALFVVTELMSAVWIRDNLILNVVMLIQPVEAIKEWQAAGH